MQAVAPMLVLFCSVALSQVAPTSPKDGAPEFPQLPSHRIKIPPLPAPKALETTSTTLVSGPDFGGYDMPVCDGAGNTYFYAGSFANYGDSTIFRLSSDPDKHQVYRLPPERADGAMFGAFNVTPAGTVWV